MIFLLVEIRKNSPGRIQYRFPWVFCFLIYRRVLWLTLFHPWIQGVYRFPEALEARLNQRGTRYHPRCDWWRR